MSESKKITVTIPIDLKSQANIREHWSCQYKRNKKYKNLVYNYLLRHKHTLQAMLPDITITLTRCSPRRLDDDNLQYAFKSVRDAISHVLYPNHRVGTADDQKGLKWEYGQISQKQKFIKIDLYSEKIP